MTPNKPHVEKIEEVVTILADALPPDIKKKLSPGEYEAIRLMFVMAYSHGFYDASALVDAKLSALEKTGALLEKKLTLVEKELDQIEGRPKTAKLGNLNSNLTAYVIRTLGIAAITWLALGYSTSTEMSWTFVGVATLAFMYNSGTYTP